MGTETPLCDWAFRSTPSHAILVCASFETTTLLVGMMRLPSTVVRRTNQISSRLATGWDNSNVRFSVSAGFS
jgi:hypothetical protein